MMNRLPGLLLSVVVLAAPASSRIVTVASAAGGAVFGVLAGTAVTAGVVVTRARLQAQYLESVNEVVGGQAAAIPVGAVAGGAAGAAGVRVLGAVVGGTVAGAALGGAIGAAIGATSSADPADAWAGGTMGGALGVVIGFVKAWSLAMRRRRRSGRDPGGARRSRRAVPLGVLVLCVAAACGRSDTIEMIRGPAVPAEGGEVESIVFLVGDAGEAVYSRYPILPALAADVEAWAETIGRDAAVAVIVLGDIVYPDGMHEPGTTRYPVDSARVASQVAVVEGPAARRHRAQLYFVAGNHDWGLRQDWEGARRLHNLEAFLNRARSRGAEVALLPPAGTGSPATVDIGDHLRVVLLDTAWWLLDVQPDQMNAVFDTVAAAIDGAGSRHVVLASHHPFASAGPHGGFFPVWRTLGLRQLLYKSGALLQDIRSRPYRELRTGLGDVFREQGRPLAWVGGHEHSLQIIAHDSATEPRFSIVSGSASKVSDTGTREGMMFRASAPGYVRLIVRANGAVDAEVMAAPPRYLSCPEEEGPASSCMVDGFASFAPIFATRLAEPDRR